MNRKELSESRRRLEQLQRDRAACEDVAQGRTEMVRATFVEREQASGATARYLAVNNWGQVTQPYVPGREAEVWQNRCARWSKLYWSMAKWRKVNREIEELMREMGRVRCLALPAKKNKPSKKRQT